MSKRKITAIKSTQSKCRQVDHSHFSIKAASRRHVLELLYKEGITAPTILDVFCGYGKIWREVYDKSDAYLGLDKKTFEDNRRTIVCDNTRYLRHVMVDLQVYDLFDIDAYGSPAECLALICHRLARKSRAVVGIALTDGSGFNAAMNSTSSGMLRYLGLSRHRGASVHHVERESILRMLIVKSCAMAGAVPESIVCLRPQGGRQTMWYLSYLMRRIDDSSQVLGE